MDKTKGSGLAVTGEEITSKIRVSLTSLFIQPVWPPIPVSGGKGIFLPPDTGRAPVTWEFSDLFLGRKARGGGQSDQPASAVFSNSFI